MNAEISEMDAEGSTGLEVRLAAHPAEIEAAQRLRYRVFYEEMGAQPSPEMAATGRDFDEFDARCDHLLVIARNGDQERVIGTYRFQRRESERFQGFYSAAEYDVSQLDHFPGRVLELGRSCVDSAWRTRMTMQNLWRGIANYVFAHDIDLMFGCASLPGTDPDALAVPLSYLHHNHMAPADVCLRALPSLYTKMNLLDAKDINAREAIAALPPLVKGYLRLGGFIGDGAVIDTQFNTTDVCVIVKTELITDKYFRHYDRTARTP